MATQIATAVQKEGSVHNHLEGVVGGRNPLAWLEGVAGGGRRAWREGVAGGRGRTAWSDGAWSEGVAGGRGRRSWSDEVVGRGVVGRGVVWKPFLPAALKDPVAFS